MPDDLRKSVEMFCLSAAVFTSILMGLKFSMTDDKIQRLVIVLAIVGFAIASTLYFAFRMRTEGKKAVSDGASNQPSEGTR